MDKMPETCSFFSHKREDNMRFIGTILKWVLRLIIPVIIVFLVWLKVAPPELIKVGDSYAAKIICSNVFLAGRDADTVLADDVQAPGNPILRAVMVEVDKSAKTVTARLLGYAAPRMSIYREGYGCTNIADDATALPELPPVPTIAALDPKAEWPQGSHAGADFLPKLSSILSDATLQGPGMRAIVVVQNGKIIGETYGAGFDEKTPLIGWSMTKSVNAILAGEAVARGMFSLNDSNLFPVWQDDSRKAITFASMAAMQAGLQFNEDYGDVSDVTRMLYLEPDMAKFTISQPLVAKPDTEFNYSTGTAVAISRYWMNKFSDPKAALAFPREALFNPLGMEGAVFETDEAGTFSGGSYLYAPARDWARIGQLLLQDGVWNGQRMLPEGFVGLMRTANSTSNGQYTQMQTWLVGPGEKPNADFGAPADAFWLQGHDGQTVAVVPSLDLVVVRMGLTPSRLGYRPQTLLAAVADMLKQ
jgi:CubicO group peptidase (beta-lactamase class C family)